MARAARILSISLITAGMVVLADVALTLAWKEPISSLYASHRQGQAADQLIRLESRYPTAADLRAIAHTTGMRPKARILANRFEPHVRHGEAIARIVVPRMHLDAVVVEGTETGTLQKGPGHYPQTPLPGAGGTIAIAGHRTTYLAPFRDIDSMRGGDEIRLEAPYATFIYRVETTRIVEPDQVGVISRVEGERLVLSACNPLYSARERFIVFARLTRVEIFDPRRGGPWPAN